jgi:hypothetical protein
MPRDLPTAALAALEQQLALRRLIGVDALAPEALAAVARLGRLSTIAPGTTLTTPEQPRRAMALVLDGDVQLRRAGRPWPRDEPKGLLDLLWLARDSMPLEVTSADGATIVELPFDGLENLLEEHFAVGLATTRALASWLFAHASPSAGFVEARAASQRPRLTARLDALAAALPFARGHVDAMLQLDDEAAEVRFERGAVVWRKDEPARSLLVPLDGAGDGSAVDAICGLGGVELLAARARSRTLTAAGRLVALRVDEESLLDVLEDHHSLARDLLAMLAAAVVDVIEAREPGGGAAQS